MVNQALAQEVILKREIARLSEDFSGVFGRETVDRYVRESLDLMKDARVGLYVPLFVDRFVRDRLRALAQVQGKLEKTMPEVLFVCVHNAGRSQMAAGLLHTLSGGRVHVRSAGSEPTDQLNPAVVTVMEELGIDLSMEFPKPLTNEVVEAADVVITMGCGDACPIFPGKRYLDWQLDDPAGQPVEVVRRIRDEIRRRVEGLLIELGVPTTTGNTAPLA